MQSKLYATENLIKYAKNMVHEKLFQIIGEIKGDVSNLSPDSLNSYFDALKIDVKSPQGKNFSKLLNLLK